MFWCFFKKFEVNKCKSGIMPAGARAPKTEDADYCPKMSHTGGTAVRNVLPVSPNVRSRPKR